MKSNRLGRALKRGAALCLALLCVGLAHGVSKAERTVRVACFPLNGFFDFAEDGTVSGYGAAYTETIFGHAGLSYELVRYASWEEALAALSRNDVDVLAPAQHTTERDAQYLFDNFPIGTEYGSLLALSTGNSLVYEDYAAFDGLNVGCVSTLAFLDDFEDYEARNGFSVHLTYYRDTPAVVAALKAGEVDAILVNMMVKTGAMKLLARFGATPFYYMLSEQAHDICDELNTAIDKVSANHPELQNDLTTEYFAEFNRIPFSKQELDFVASSDVLTVGCGADYAPFSYLNAETGEIAGVGRAILEQISALSGLKFRYAAIPFDGNTQAFFAENNVAMVAGVENDERNQLHNSGFSESYLTIAKYFIGLKQHTLDTSVSANIAVVSAADSQIASWKGLYPNFTFVRYGSISDCIAAIRTGEADYLLDNRYSLENVLASPRNQDLHVFPDEVVESRICFRILLTDESDAELLASVLNKAIREIPENDKERYISIYTQANRYQYTASDFLYQYRIQLLCIALLLAVMIAALSMVLHARRKAGQAIQENEAKLQNITNNINGGVIVLKDNAGLNISYANDGFLELIGCTREAFETEHEGSYRAYVHPDDLPKVQSALDADHTEMSLELRVRRSDGGYVPALFNCTAERKKNGEKELYCVILDMTEQNKLLEQLRIEKRRTDLILERVDEIFYEINLADHTCATSPSFMERLGWTLPAVMPDDRDDNYRKMWHTDEPNLDKLRESTDEMRAKKEPVSAIVQMQSVLEQRPIWCEIFQHPILSEDKSIVSIIGLIRDVDEQVSERERLLEQAQRDPLTGLYNKEAFETIVTDTLVKLPNQNHAMIFIDLDHFKGLNDTLGHMTGDRAICEAADKLRIIFSNYDILSRFGGDEFCIFVKNIPLETLRGKMEWLVDKVHAEYRSEKGSARITCSCGIACTAQVGFAYKRLMECADEALYASKEQGRDRFTFYHEIRREQPKE